MRSLGDPRVRIDAQGSSSRWSTSMDLGPRGDPFAKFIILLNVIHGQLNHLFAEIRCGHLCLDSFECTIFQS
jgi:hypothetical protein